MLLSTCFIPSLIPFVSLNLSLLLALVSVDISKAVPVGSAGLSTPVWLVKPASPPPSSSSSPSISSPSVYPDRVREPALSINWNTPPTHPKTSSTNNQVSQPFLFSEPLDMGSETNSATPPPTPLQPTTSTYTSKTTWNLSPTFSNIAQFSISHYAGGLQNIAVMSGSPGPSPPSMSNSVYVNGTNWVNLPNSLQVLYPNGSSNPSNSPQGGTEFYATPLDISNAYNVSLEYSVYFPADFDFVQGGKLPGLFGGHKGCSGGNDASDCFSTRMMWRTGGMGELYLYVPKTTQTPSLCSTPPLSICTPAYGLSIARGSFNFSQGGWTTIRQDIWLNTPGVNDGGFNIWVNGELKIHAEDVRYRDQLAGCAPAVSANQETFVSNSSNSSSFNGDTASMADSTSVATDGDGSGCSVGFVGLFFSTFFGGNGDDWASPRDQYTYFRDFQMAVNA